MRLYERQRIKYNTLVEEEVASKGHLQEGVRTNKGPVVEYILVTFKNTESTQQATDVTTPEPFVQKCFRRLCCIANRKQHKKEF